MLRQCELHKREPKPGNERKILGEQPQFDADTAANVRVCLDCWHECSADRHIGMAVGDIPTLAIRAWCAAERIDADATRILIRVVRYLDGERNAKEASKRALNV